MACPTLHYTVGKPHLQRLYIETVVQRQAEDPVQDTGFCVQVWGTAGLHASMAKPEERHQ